MPKDNNAQLKRVRIIAGQYGGQNIKTPHNNGITHPMGDRVRSAIFSIIGDSIKGCDILDSFAGSGSLGFESLSRGAKSVVFIDNNIDAKNTILENIKKLNINDKCTVIKTKINTYVDQTTEKFDIIFADPPYNDPQFSTVKLLFGLLKPGALMVLSHPGKGEVSFNGKKIVVVDNRSYSSAFLTFYRRVQ